MINIQTSIPMLFALIMSMMTTLATANNSISWNPAPTSISSGSNDITLNYSTNQNSIIVVQLFDENWNPIGQQEQNVSAGSEQITLTLTPDSTPSATNFLQAKLLDNSWTPLVETLQVNVSYAGSSGANSLAWNPEPTIINSGNNNITLDYSIDEDGVVFVQIFDEDWDKFDDHFVNVSAGSGQVTLPLTVSSPSANNYLQAFLFDSAWGEIGVPRLELTLPGQVSPPPATNSLTWNPVPTGISAGTNDFTLDYSIDQSGLIFIQVFDENWNRFDYKFENVSAGSGQITLPLTVSSPSANNYLQAFLYDANWTDIGVPRLDLTLTSTYTSDCGPVEGVCKVYPERSNQLLGTKKHYEANMYVSSEWNGPLKAFWGEPEGIFWVEWDNNGSGASSEEFDYKALRSEWTYDRIENGFPTRINQIPRSDLNCEATGQWTAGSSGRCHINMTAWISENFDREEPCGTKCDIIIHTWDNSGTFKDKFTPEGNTDIGEDKCIGQVVREFRYLGTIIENNITYDVLRTMPGGVGEKASYNIIPQNFRPNPDAPFDTDRHTYNIDVKKFVKELARREADLPNNTPVFNEDWWLQGMEWTVTGQSGDESVGVPNSKGKWTFFNYKIPNISLNSNKVETDMQSINFGVSPNPFTTSFNIEYDLTQSEPVSIQLLTQEGKRIKVIKNKENEAAGNHIETINTSDLPSGIYLIHLTTSDSHGVQKLIKF